MLVALGTIAAQQASATQATSKYVTLLLYYCHTHPDAKVCYHARDFYLGNTAYVRPTMPNNGVILNTSTIMLNVMAFASKAECGALFKNTKEVVSLRTTLYEIGHPQPPTPVEVDNSSKLSSKIPNPWT